MSTDEAALLPPVAAGRSCVWLETEPDAVNVCECVSDVADVLAAVPERVPAMVPEPQFVPPVEVTVTACV